MGAVVVDDHLQAPALGANAMDLVGAIRRFIDGWSERCHPFTWATTADQILPHATRQPTSDAGR